MTLISQDDHLKAGAWAACGHRKISLCQNVSLPRAKISDVTARLFSDVHTAPKSESSATYNKYM